MCQLDVHEWDVKNYLIVTIKTIDFTDSRFRSIMRVMEQSYYLLEVLAKDRLDRARVDAGRRRLLRRAQGLRAPLPV